MKLKTLTLPTPTMKPIRLNKREQEDRRNTPLRLIQGNVLQIAHTQKQKRRARMQITVIKRTRKTCVREQQQTQKVPPQKQVVPRLPILPRLIEKLIAKGLQRQTQ